MMTMDWDEIVDTSARLLHEAKVLDALLSEAHASGSAPLPAPALTEQAIVDALKEDPAMAGRVIAAIAWKTPHEVRCEIGEAAKRFVSEGGTSLRGSSLQSLAVALAAASYRG